MHGHHRNRALRGQVADIVIADEPQEVAAAPSAFFVKHPCGIHEVIHTQPAEIVQRVCPVECRSPMGDKRPVAVRVNPAQQFNR